MKYKYLREFMKRKNLSTPYEYANNDLVIDGLCFKDSYKMSGCPFILGGEYDRFASSFKNLLNMYIKSGLTCYVVFTGSAETDMETRTYIHQKIIDKTDAIKPGSTYEYCEPIFVKDVCKEILDELNIKHYTCNYGNKEVLFNLANKLECPILTNNFEIALFGGSVIPFRSVKYNEAKQSITCTIYWESNCRRSFPFTDDLMSIIMTITDEDSHFYNELLEMFPCRRENYTSSMLYWIRRQNKESATRLIKSHLNEENRKLFIDTVAELRRLFYRNSNLPAVNFLINDLPMLVPELKLTNISDRLFEYYIGVGRIATPFVNLKNIGTFSGSWVVYNKDREDAMLVASDIALYARGLLTNSQEVKITFIGRQHDVCHVSVIKKIVNIQTQRKRRKASSHKNSESIDHFLNFVNEQLPGFDLITLESSPKDSWMLLISLLYYNGKAGVDITNVVYSIILSYVLLGAVSEKVGIIKKSNFSVSHGATSEESGDATDKCNTKSSLTQKQCSKVTRAVIDLFYAPDTTLKDNFDRDALHTLAEFQHCLQLMNYLNRLCGEKIKCTSYQKTINCTFIYNIFVLLKNKTNPGDYIELLINCPPVYSYFKNILDTYYKCLCQLDRN